MDSTPTKTWSTKRTGFKVTDKGALYLEFSTARVYALRPDPARCWTGDLGRAPRWYSLKEPPLEPGSRIRELRSVDGAVTPAIVAVKDKEALHAAQQHTPYFVRRRENVRKFLAHVPVAEQDVIARVGAGSWGLYRFLHGSPAALELCATDAGLALAFLLAHGHRLLGPPVDDDDHFPEGGDVATSARRRSLAIARALLPRKRKDIVGRFGLPPTKATLQALGKIPAAQLSPDLLVDVRAVLLDEWRRHRAAHLPVLSAAALKLLRSPWWPQLAPTLLHEVALSDDLIDVDGPARMLRHLVALAQQLGQPVPYLHSMGQLVATHDALTVEARQWLKAAKAPLPPLPEVLTADERRWVEPLPTLQAMVQEGAAMHHCLGTLMDQRQRAQQGHFFAFALHWPVRLTLAVVCDATSPWQVYDLRGFANSEAPAVAWAWAKAFVERWNRRFPVGLRDDPTAPTQLPLFQGLAPGVRFDLLDMLEESAPF